MKIEPGQEHSWEAFFPDVDLSFTDKEGKEIGPPAGLSWVRPVAWGFGKLLSWLHDTYGWDIYVYVGLQCVPVVADGSSENGVVCPDEDKLPREQAVNDDFRCDYLTSYADQIALKIQHGVPVKSYLMWAWTDNFECRLPTRGPGSSQGKKATRLGSGSFGSTTRMVANGTPKSRSVSCGTTLQRECRDKLYAMAVTSLHDDGIVSVPPSRLS